MTDTIKWVSVDTTRGRRVHAVDVYPTRIGERYVMRCGYVAYSGNVKPHRPGPPICAHCERLIGRDL